MFFSEQIYCRKQKEIPTAFLCAIEKNCFKKCRLNETTVWICGEGKEKIIMLLTQREIELFKMHLIQ